MSYREGKVTDSTDEELLESYRNLKTKKPQTNEFAGYVGNSISMSNSDISEIVRSAVQAALNIQAQALEKKFQELEGRIGAISLTNTEVKAYGTISVDNSVKCEEPLDIVKSIPEFDGKQENYVSWRQAANAAYTVFKPFNGSSRHYQAVAIIRNKIRGNADAV